MSPLPSTEGFQAWLSRWDESMWILSLKRSRPRFNLWSRHWCLSPSWSRLKLHHGGDCTCETNMAFIGRAMACNAFWFLLQMWTSVVAQLKVHAVTNSPHIQWNSAAFWWTLSQQLGIWVCWCPHCCCTSTLISYGEDTHICLYLPPSIPGLHFHVICRKLNRLPGYHSQLFQRACFLPLVWQCTFSRKTGQIHSLSNRPLEKIAYWETRISLDSGWLRTCCWALFTEVSVGSYVRFLNLAMPRPTEAELLDWCVLQPNDTRRCHMPIVRHQDKWQVKDEVPVNWPMFLVSWYGANAYSLWVHGKDWQTYKSSAESFLPTEAQWEYAARGKDPQDFPWGKELNEDLLNVCWDAKTHVENGQSPPALRDFPLESVNLTKGQSPFGLRGMAGNVWQWCRDTYDPDFYSSSMAVMKDAWNCTEGYYRAERGGSWVGPAHLARSSYRRGRCPEAKGRCLGFRCCAPATYLNHSPAWNLAVQSTPR